MAERAAVTQGLQIGVETTPGTIVPANKTLLNLSLTPTASVQFNKFRPSGYKFATNEVPAKDMVQSKIDGLATYSEMVYLLSSLMSFAAPVQQTATTAYKWTHAIQTSLEDTVKTLSFEQGSSVRAHKAAYGLVTGLDFEFTRDAATFSGTMIHQALSDGIALTNAPTAIENKPIDPKHVTVYLDTASGSLGTTRLTRVLKAQLKIDSRFNPLWAVNDANSSYAAHVETLPTPQIVLLLEADSSGMGLLSDARAINTKFIRIAAVSNTFADAGTTYPYSFTFDAAAQVSAISEFQDSDGVYAVEYTLDLVHDATWGKSNTCSLINKLTAL